MNTILLNRNISDQCLITCTNLRYRIAEVDTRRIDSYKHFDRQLRVSLLL